MSRVLLTCQDGKPLHLFNDAAFSQEQYDLLCQKGAALSLLPGAYTCTGAQEHTIVFQTDMLQPLGDVLRGKNAAGFLALIEDLSRKLLVLRGTGGFSIGNVLLDMDCIFADASSRVWFIYSCCTGASVTPYERTFIAQLKKYVRIYADEPGMQEFWAVLDDPFVDIDAIHRYFVSKKCQTSNNGDSQMPVAGREGTKKRYSSEVMLQMADRMNDMRQNEQQYCNSTDAGYGTVYGNAVTYQPAGYSGAGFYTNAGIVNTGNGGVNNRIEQQNQMDMYAAGMDEPTMDQKSAYAQPPQSPLNSNYAVGMDQPTMDNSPATVPAGYGPVYSGFATGMDQPTTDQAPAYAQIESRLPSATNTVNLDQLTVDSQPKFVTPKSGLSNQNASQNKGGIISMPSMEESSVKLEKLSVNRAAIENLEPKLRAKCPKGIPLEKWVVYCKRMKAWRRNLFFVLLTLVGFVLAGILIYAFAGYIGLLIMVLLTVILTALLWRFDKLNWLIKPKKPQTLFAEPKRPAIDPVFTVRIKICSTNLNTPVEIIIRQQEQAIGSSSSICPTPLKYVGISRKHCTISCIKTTGHAEYYICDENSRNGTELNGEKLIAGNNYPLHVGDHIVLAHRYTFDVRSDAR